MLRRLKKVLVTMIATATVVVALLIVVSVVGQRYQFSSTPSVNNADILILHGDNEAPIQCYRDNNGVTIETDNGHIRAVMVGREGLERCIEAYKSGRIPFDPRNFVGKYEAGYTSWEGFDHENIYDWGSLPGECEPHYQFKEKSHPWLVDALGLVDTIEVTFKWTGTDSEWQSCYTAREKQIAEIDLSELEVTIDSAPN